MKNKITYSQRLLICPSPESGRQVYYTHVPNKSEWVNTSHYIAPISPNHRPPSTHRRVYKPGRKIRSMDSLSRWVDCGGYVFLGHKSYHPGWLRGFQFGYVLRNLQMGKIRKAVKI